MGDKCNDIVVVNRDRFHGQNKRVLTFGDSYITPPPIIICESNAISHNPRNNDAYNNKFPNTDNRNSSLNIPTSDRLLRTVDENVAPIYNIPSYIERQNFIDVDNQETAPHRPEESGGGNDRDNIQVAYKHNIEWDDIFDRQLLQDLSILDTDISLNPEKQVKETDNSLRGEDDYENNSIFNKNNNGIPKNMRKIKPQENSTINSNGNRISEMLEKLPVHENIEARCELVHPVGENINYLLSRDIIQDDIPRNLDIIKRVKPKRHRSPKNMNSTAKKVKKAGSEQTINSFRKQKYTKTVKNWLNDVNPEDFENLEESQNPLINDAEIKESSNGKKLNKKNSKKTVQAQLTNKGGVMKFGKPKNASEDSEKHKIPADDVIIRNITKDKKHKAKFVAPIKSQVPVKDINYNIIRITSDNLEEYENTLNIAKDEEIDMILTFSNGFCELNSQYTEDTCIVEGVMFQITNTIYYWNGDYKLFSNTMKNIIDKNIIISYDGKNLLKYFTSQHNMDIHNTKILDTQIGGNLLDPDNPPETFANLQKLLCFAPEYTIATECVLQKCAWYLTMLGESFVKLRTLLIDKELWKVFTEIEMRVLPIIADMERRGVRVDTQRLKWMEGTLLTRMKATEQACHKAAGRAFQVNSALQVRTILYEELHLDTKGNVKIRETLSKGEKSTSESMLRSLISVHSLPKLILEYRHLHKAHATFLAGISHQVKEGIVKPTWVQTAAATGRIASNNPNLQAIPKAPFNLVLFPTDSNDEGTLTENQILNFRSVYIPREGHTMLAADFKHIECRVFAYAAADTSLLDALSSPDLFRVLAAKWLNKSAEEVSSEDRERTKRIVYASLYGAGTRKLMEILNVSYDQALSITSSFNRTFPSLKSFGRAVVSECGRRGGRLATPRGRLRAFRDIASADAALKAHAERQAVNFIVQGTAADLCKMAMVETAERMRTAKPPIRGHLLLQIHDELVWEVEHQDLERAAATIKSAMEGVGHVCGMPITLPVSVAAGPSWGEMEEYMLHTF
ncbi:DNA polymerase theta-like [Epargyreus clarus]|uniref:DNA polymerase theta-like n=1 Tax=Epargyreus clarus TaxID=520877 RepID=UPI003C309B9D